MTQKAVTPTADADSASMNDLLTLIQPWVATLWETKNTLTGRRPCPPPFLCLCHRWLSFCCTVCAWCTSAGRSAAGRSSWRPPGQAAGEVLRGQGPPQPRGPDRWRGILLTHRQSNVRWRKRSAVDTFDFDTLGFWNCCSVILWHLFFLSISSEGALCGGSCCGLWSCPMGSLIAVCTGPWCVATPGGILVDGMQPTVYFPVLVQTDSLRRCFNSREALWVAFLGWKVLCK